jgi:multidrug efflux pump subunit AcrB
VVDFQFVRGGRKMIPKYVYEEMKQNVQRQLCDVKTKVINAYKEKIDKEIKDLFREYENQGRVFLVAEASVHTTYPSGVSTDPRISVMWTDRFRQQFSEDTEKLKSVIELRKVLDDLDKQYSDWELSVYRKIANGEGLTLPSFRTRNLKLSGIDPLAGTRHYVERV